MPSTVSKSWPPLLLILLATLVGCTPAPKPAGERDGAAPQAAAPGGQVPAPVAQPPAVEPPAPTADPVPAPAVAAPADGRPELGRKELVVSLPKNAKLGGFELALRFDAKRFALEEPKPAAALAGYLCAANVDIPGELRWSCAGLPAGPVGGELGVSAVHWLEGSAPVVGEFDVTRNFVVDDVGAEMEGVRLELQLR